MQSAIDAIVGNAKIEINYPLLYNYRDITERR
jgi:hypothetical protein